MIFLQNIPPYRTTPNFGICLSYGVARDIYCRCLVDCFRFVEYAPQISFCWRVSLRFTTILIFNIWEECVMSEVRRKRTGPSEYVFPYLACRGIFDLMQFCCITCVCVCILSLVWVSCPKWFCQTTDRTLETWCFRCLTWLISISITPGCQSMSTQNRNNFNDVTWTGL